MIVTSHSPQTPEELFNNRHARLRNVIERIFGVIKRRFKVLVIAQEYSLETQSQLISGLAVLHNFIRIHDPTDTLDEDLAEEEPTNQDPGSIDNSNLRERALGNEERERAAERREAIARAMWQDYQHKRQRKRAPR